MATMQVYKFLIPSTGWRADPKNPGMSWKGCMASCIASNEGEARVIVQVYAASNGLDCSWLAIADVIKLPVDNGTFIAWAQA